MMSQSAFADLPTVAYSTTMSSIAVGQSGANNADRKRESDDLLRRARTAMKAGSYDEADRLITQAEKLKVTTDSIFLRLADTPDKARKDLLAMKAKSTASKSPSDRFAPPPLITDTSSKPTTPAPGTFGTGTVNSAIPSAGEPRDQAEMLTRDTTGAPAFNTTATTKNATLGPPPEFTPSQADRLPTFGSPANLTAGNPTLPNRDTTSFQPAVEMPGPSKTPDLKLGFEDKFDKKIADTPPPARRISDFDGAPAAAGEAEQMLWDARRAIARGDMQQAKALVEKVRSRGGNFPFEADSPERVDALIRRFNEVNSSYAAGRPDAVRTKSQFLMEQADGLLRYKDVEQAEALANEAKKLGVEYRTFERTPDRLIGQISSMRGTCPVACSLYMPVSVRSATRRAVARCT
jgi:general secretion pathway protein D